MSWRNDTPLVNVPCVGFMFHGLVTVGVEGFLCSQVEPLGWHVPRLMNHFASVCALGQPYCFLLICASWITEFSASVVC